ncbi:hypothetical protein AKJ09_04469 [Labilithrix luteola]|uniref:Outer membrane lipoprotein BamD-like domain-containing protein n=1 Tax=Labilithrix luteola TaxID=1391654 RepID=A0A0K1PWA7_9BACT|nr:outer membrane protein assembly factor BamD [Labilithrix luteola]AKU97805.1 hypothetical protein AKJ09_04469 [Labilithrix luteola]
MKDGPERLIHEDPGFARLVAASDREAPSRELLEDALSRSAPRSSWWSWGGPGLAVGIAALGVSVLGMTTMAPEASLESRGVMAPVSPVSSASSALPAPPVKPVAEPPIATISVDDLASAPPERPKSAAPSGTVTRVQADAGSPSFADELALVTAARSALEAGDASACMRAVDRYDQRFHGGLFAQEIEVLRIEALVTSGERARAQALSDRFLSANPRSPYAARVRSLLERTRD